MNLAQLNQQYPNGELTSVPGDPNFRYEVLAPLFNNLYENKVIFHERATVVLKLEDIKITPDKFEAKAIRQLLIGTENRINKVLPPKIFPVGSNWAYLKLIGNVLMPYSGWLMWVDPELVKKVEELTLEMKFTDALNLTYNDFRGVIRGESN